MGLSGLIFRMWLDCNYFNKNRLSDALLMQRLNDDIVIVLQKRTHLFPQ